MQNKALQSSLEQAQKVVDGVMKEGGSALRQYVIPYDSIVFGETIGEGAFGTVFKGTCNGIEVAVKTVR